MAAVEVPQTLEYRGGQLNAAPVLEEAKRTMDSANEEKAANLDAATQKVSSSARPSDDQMNSIINCLIAKSTWDDLIVYHEGTSDVKENSPDNEEDTRSSYEYLNDLERRIFKQDSLAKSKNILQKLQSLISITLFNYYLSFPSQHKPKLRGLLWSLKLNTTKQAKLALLSSSASLLYPQLLRTKSSSLKP
ncbi:hypothetical protein Tco_1447841 [Tanacetum coccineum]